MPPISMHNHKNQRNFLFEELAWKMFHTFKTQYCKLQEKNVATNQLSYCVKAIRWSFRVIWNSWTLICPNKVIACRVKYETRSNSNKWWIKEKSIGTTSESKLGALTRFRGREWEVVWEVMRTPIRAQYGHLSCSLLLCSES